MNRRQAKKKIKKTIEKTKHFISSEELFNLYVEIARFNKNKIKKESPFLKKPVIWSLEEEDEGLTLTEEGREKWGSLLVKRRKKNSEELKKHNLEEETKYVDLDLKFPKMDSGLVDLMQYCPTREELLKTKITRVYRKRHKRRNNNEQTTSKKEN